MSLINSRSAPAVAADLQGRGKAAICPPPRAKPRAKMEAVAKPRRCFEGGTGKRPGAAAKKAEAAAPRAGAAPVSSALRRQRPPLGALSGRMRDAGGCGGRGVVLGSSTSHGAPAPQQRPAPGFVKAFFVGGERFAINTTARATTPASSTARIAPRGMRLAVAARAYERGRRRG